jgi:hypothetical protein
VIWRSRGRLRSGASIGAIVLVVGVAATASVMASNRPPAQGNAIALPADSPAPTPPGTTGRVSIADDERQANSGSGGVNDIITASNGDQAISADGRWVAFVSTATNLIPGESHPNGGLFLRDRQDGRTIAVPWVDANAFPSLVRAAEPSISADGSVVAFTAILSRTATTSIVGSSTFPYVLAWEQGARASEVISVDDNQQPIPGYQPSISGDGFTIAYPRWFIKPAPTTTPDTSGPAITNLKIAGAAACGTPAGWFCIFISSSAGQGCPPPNAATVSVDVTDPSGVTDVRLWWRQGGGGYTGVALNRSGDHWSGVISALDRTEAPVEYYWEAFDALGNYARLDNTSDRRLAIYGCIL